VEQENLTVHFEDKSLPAELCLSSLFFFFDRSLVARFFFCCFSFLPFALQVLSNTRLFFPFLFLFFFLIGKN
jgi:hypothetical protein